MACRPFCLFIYGCTFASNAAIWFARGYYATRRCTWDREHTQTPWTGASWAFAYSPGRPVHLSTCAPYPTIPTRYVDVHLYQPTLLHICIPVIVHGTKYPDMIFMTYDTLDVIQDIFNFTKLTLMAYYVVLYINTLLLL